MWGAQQMGYKDWGLTGKIYGKWIPDAAPEAGCKAVAMFGGEYAEVMLLRDAGEKS